jgi:ribosome-associated protein
MSQASPQDTNPRPLTPLTADASDAPLTPSTSQRKRDAQAFQALGVQLVALSAAQLARLDLPEALHEAVVAAQRMRSHGARTRHLQSSGKVMRQLEPDALRRVRTALETGRAGIPRPQP